MSYVSANLTAKSSRAVSELAKHTRVHTASGGRCALANVLNKDSVHITVFSDENTPIARDGEQAIFQFWEGLSDDDKRVRATRISVLGEDGGTVVLKLECKAIEAVHAMIRDALGHTHKFPNFDIHTSLAYDTGEKLDEGDLFVPPDEFKYFLECTDLSIFSLQIAPFVKEWRPPETK